MHEGRMATGAGEGGGHTALENTTATALTESSSSSSSSSVPTILAENNTSTNLPLPGPQQQTLHQVQQQQQTQQQQQQQQQQTHSRPPINLVTDLPANDTSDIPVGERGEPTGHGSKRKTSCSPCFSRSPPVIVVVFAAVIYVTCAVSRETVSQLYLRPCIAGRAAEGRERALRESNEARRQLVVRR
ncbi:forkhead box protein O-like [Bombus huntii]|uniref:forkhead box protein O-like n=1 Tax=Bombus huntii TaxID=85661 RepID=UPI0021AA7530|nr:forkhead box protein O-like [Bombus huntii]